MQDKSFAEFYQEECTRTLREPIKDIKENEVLRRDTLINMALGLTGESGEVIDQIKKYAYQGHMLDKEHMAEEIGDVLWYLMNLCNLLDIGINEVMRGNVSKLRERYPNGFSEDNSVNRVI